MKSVLAATAGILCLSIGTARADDIVRLKGSDAATVNLKGSANEQADTVSVFHGRLLGCCGRRCCPPPVVCCAPVPVYYGCVGGFGGYSVAPVAPVYGYAAASLPPIASPAQAYAFAPRNESQYQYPPQPPRAIVALPRLGMSFTLGDASETLNSRFGNPYQPDSLPREERPAAPPAFQIQPDQFRYDGGPSNPIPMPGRLRPLPNAAPLPAATNNRVKATISQPGWLAYGDRPSIPSDSQLVRTRER